MPALKHTQRAFMAALEGGPAHMPPGLFAGRESRSLLGMKVHANTVSHARLVALEDSFPRTRALLGHDRFNARSRQFVATPEPAAEPLTLIGRHFPRFLAMSGEIELMTDLAAFEWAWLTAYHAQDRDALALDQLSGLDQSALLAVKVARHPAASMGRIGAALGRHLDDEIPGLADEAVLLLTRPQSEVRAAPASLAMWSLFAELENPECICNLFALVTEPDRKDHLSPHDFMPALIALLEAGALRRAS